MSYLIISFPEPEKLAPDSFLIDKGLIAICSPTIDLKGPRNTLLWCDDKTLYDEWAQKLGSLLFPAGHFVSDSEPLCLGFLFKVPPQPSFYLINTLVKRVCHLLQLTNCWYRTECCLQLPDGQEQFAIQLKFDDADE